MFNHHAPSCQSATVASMTRLLRALFEFEGDAVQAIAQAGRCRAVIEDVAEMRTATRAKHFVAFHPEAAVFHTRDDSRNEWLCETGPARAGFELGIAGEQWRVAAGAMENAAAMLG